MTVEVAYSNRLAGYSAVAIPIDLAIAEALIEQFRAVTRAAAGGGRDKLAAAVDRSSPVTPRLQAISFL